MLEHWYGESLNELSKENVNVCLHNWFVHPTDKFVEEQRDAASLIHAVAAGEAEEEWNNLQDPRVVCARVVLFDQVSVIERHVI